MTNILCYVYRYTFFYVLYPVGVTGELLIYWTSLGYIGRTNMWSIEMPNRLNISFSLWTVIAFIMFIYIPRKFVIKYKTCNSIIYTF